MKEYDIIAIGSGSSMNIISALAGKNKKIAVIEKDEPGGICLTRGCIPTKALIHAAEVWDLCRKGARTFGITVGEASFDWTKVQRRKEMATTKGSKGVELAIG